MGHPALVLIKSMQYRGNAEEWSNIYHFLGPAPSDAAAWWTLTSAVAVQEKVCYTSDVTIVRAYGYADADQDSVWSRDLVATSSTIIGALPASTSVPCPGDAAVWVRWATAKRNSKGKVVYLRKYFHGARATSAALPDQAWGNQRAAMEGFAAKCVDGTISAAFKVCANDGTPGGASASSPYITTRTLKRRGKRPPS